MSASSGERGVAVREAAVRILVRVDRDDALAGVLLDRAEPALADARDRALLHEIVLGVLRRRPSLDRAIAALAGRPIASLDPEVRACLRVGLHGLWHLDRVPDHAIVHVAVEVARRIGAERASGLVNAVLRRAARERQRWAVPDPAPGDADALALATGHPVWWTRRWIGRLGWDRARAVLQANNAPGRTVVRVRAGHDVDEIARALAAAGADPTLAGYVPRALVVGTGRVVDSRPFRDGALYIHDEASQMVAPIAAAGPRGRVLDCCSAPGGKAIHVSELVGPGVPVVALDRSPARLRLLADNLRRLHAADVLPVCADAEIAPLPVRERAWPVVVVDAPCSGTGTMRRHPEIRWRLRPTDLREHGERQRRILDHAARCVRPGGRLVYSVCSIEPEEGEDVVGRFLDDRRDFRAADPAADLPEPCRRFVGPDLALRTFPDDGVDGFFVAALDRAAE